MARGKKWLLLSCLLVSGAAAIGLVLVVLSRPAAGPGVTWRNYSAIRYGTTQQEVEAVLGGPPVEKVPYPEGAKDSVPSVAVARWPGENLTIEVYFSADGRVVRLGSRRITSFSLDEFFSRLFRR
jgi:hypothetical protein